ncbi:MAG: metallophosphoesterase [Planctomycetota bacterium]
MSVVMGWLIFLASVAGHTELWIMAVNRTHALPIRAKKLRRFRTLHDVAVVAYPLILFSLTGLGPDSLLRGARFRDQTEFVRWLLVVTLPGCVPLILGLLRWQLIRRRQFHQADERRVIHVLSDAISQSDDPDAGTRVRGPRVSMLHRVPGSQIFQLEVNRKTVRRGRLQQSDAAEEREPLRIVHLSDLHFVGCPGEDFYRRMVEEVINIQPHLVVFSGDLIDQVDLLPTAIEILQPLTRLAPAFFVLGNHDWRYDDQMIRQQLTESGWNGVAGISCVVRVAGRTVLIAGTERPWMGTNPPDATHAGADLKILISHSPDQISFAGKCGFDLMLSGHTHGGQVVLPVIGPVYSPSIHGVSFVSGLFDVGKLTLHVTRGVGAKDPLRLNCTPEVTCLEVHC